MNNTEVRIIGICAECGNEIDDNMTDIYVDENGNYFCSVDCVLEYHKIAKVEA